MSNRIVKFTAYPFVKRDEGFWIARGILRDDQVNDWVQYDYTLPLRDSEPRSKAELGAAYELASTAALVLPSGVPVHVTWCFSHPDTVEQAPLSETLIERFINASNSYSIELMEPTVRAIADLEAEPDADQDPQSCSK